MQKKVTYETSRQELVGVTLPEESRTYKPFTHQQVIDLTLDGIAGAGFKLGRDKYRGTKSGEVAIGEYSIVDVADTEMQLQISWMNSYNKTKRLTWGIGSQVFICENGNISADFGTFKKKHQGDIQDYSPRAITEHIKRATNTFREMQKEREQMKQIEVDKLAIAHILGELFMNEDFIQSTQLNIIKEQVLNPSFDYNADGSLWQLYNHITYSLKEIHPALYMKHHMDAHKFFVNKGSILVPKQEILVPEVGSHPQAEIFNTSEH